LPKVPVVDIAFHEAQVEQRVGIEELPFCGLPTDWHMGQLDYLGGVGMADSLKGRLPAENYEE
jgi:hypothetical protein